MSKLCCKTLSISALLLASISVVQAADEKDKSPWQITSNVGFTSDYVFRGFTQTDEGMAIQGGFDVAHSSGLSAGVWGSNVKFLEPDSVHSAHKRAHIEVDTYINYGGEITMVNGLSYSVGFIRYNYPDSSKDIQWTTNEGNAGLTYTYQDLSTNFKYSYTPDYFGKNGKAHYFDLSGTYKLPQNFAIGLHVGRQNFSDKEKSVIPNYTDYKVTVSYSYADYVFSLNYSDTDAKKTDKFDPKNVADGRVFAAVVRTF